MIVDTLEHLGRYAALGPRFADAIACLLHTDWAQMQPGRMLVEENAVWVNLTELALRTDAPRWEAHVQYADIHVVLRGEETYGWGFAKRIQPVDREKDFCACEEVREERFTLQAGEFALFLPGEAHAPGLTDVAGATCRKLIAKVRCAR